MCLGLKRLELKGENKREMEGESDPCREMLQTAGGDTNWGVGGVSLRKNLIFLLSWIEEMLTRLWQMSGMFVLVSNLPRYHVAEMLEMLTRKTIWKRQGW